MLPMESLWLLLLVLYASALGYPWLFLLGLHGFCSWVSMVLALVFYGSCSWVSMDPSLGSLWLLLLGLYTSQLEGK